MLGPDGQVKSWNLGAERILGYSAAEVLGRNYSVFHFAGDVRQGLPERDLEAALAQGKLEIEGWRRRKDQSWFWAHVGFTPMRKPSGALLGFATVIRDSTEKRRAEESLRQARDELELRVRDRTAELAAANQALQAEILERKQAQEILLKQSSVLRSILDSIGDAIIVAEDVDRPLTFNPAARELFGIKTDSVSLEEWLDMDQFGGVDSADPRPQSRIDGPLRRALRGEEFDDLELIVRRSRPDQVRWIQAKARPRRDPDGKYRGAVVAFRDITERRQHDQELKIAKEAAESASRAKDRFLAMLSHELRTPLTPVLLGASDLLERPYLRPEMRSTLAMIHRNVQLEARLIDDLLDLTRATSGRLTLSLASVDVHRVIEHAVEVCRAEITDSGLELGLDLAARYHYLQGDATRLQQVFWNLIKNATKFTPRGGKVTIRTWDSTGEIPGGEGPTLGAEVSDTGIGIEADRLPKIFNAFEERDPQRQRLYGGLGLGLAISRSVIQAHGGHLSASSAGRNRGSTFRIDLAAQPISRLDAPASDAGIGLDADGIRPEGLRILLVDDNRDTLGYMTGILDQRGYRVDSAINYRTALKLARGNTYDLLISDIELPDGTGLDIMRELRGRRPTPGIAVSGFGSADDVAQSLESGFALHLVKPIDVRALAAAIASVTAKHAVKATPRGCSRESSSQLAPYDHPSRGEALAV